MDVRQILAEYKSLCAMSNRSSVVIHSRCSPFLLSVLKLKWPMKLCPSLGGYANPRLLRNARGQKKKVLCTVHVSLLYFIIHFISVLCMYVRAMQELINCGVPPKTGAQHLWGKWSWIHGENFACLFHDSEPHGSQLSSEHLKLSLCLCNVTKRFSANTRIIVHC